MDHKIKASFLRVSAAPQGKTDFPDLLLGIAQLPKPGKREREISPGVTLRLERCHQAGGFVHGEFCRKQTRNIPPSAGDAGLVPIMMEHGHGLGHTAAFLYHVPTRVLLLQNNRQCATPARVSAYVSQYETGAFYSLSQIPSEDALANLNSDMVREFTVQFATPENMEAVEREDIAAGRAAREAAAVYNATTVTITVSAGPQRKSYLDPGAIRQMLKRLSGKGSDASKLLVKSKTSVGTKLVDLLEASMQAEAELDLPEGDHEAHYRTRSSWLREAFHARQAHLTDLYG